MQNRIQREDLVQHVNKHFQNEGIVLLLKVQTSDPSVIVFGLLFVLTVVTAQK